MSADSDRIAFVTPSIPYPPRNGGHVVSLAALRHLSEIGRVDLFALEPDRSESDAPGRAKVLAETCASVRVYPWHRGRSPASLIGSYLARLPLSVYRNSCHALQNALGEYCRRHPKAVLVSDHWLSAEAVLRSRQPRQPCVLHTLNAEYVMWQRHSTGSRLVQAVIRHEARRVREYERRLISAFDRVVTLSTLDADRLRCLEPDLPDDRLCCIRPAVDPLPGPNDWASTSPQLLFVGTLSWPPNVLGLERFISDVWPAVRRRFPTARLTVVGGGLSAESRRRYAACPGVDVRGFVEDLDPLFAASRVFVAPVIGGSGVKIKILEAMARGIPVLTTPDGAEGIDVPSSVLLTFSDCRQLAGQLERIWASPTRWQELASASRAEVFRNYLRSGVGGAWRQLIEGLWTSGSGKERLPARAA